MSTAGWGGFRLCRRLSRLNRSWSEGGLKKETTYVLDFANNAEDILAAFRTYYETAELEDVTDPNQVLDLRAQLDSLGYYDDHEVERVVRADLDPKATHASLSAAIEPVADRLLKEFKDARDAEHAARAKGDEKAAQSAKQVQEALKTFRSNMGAFLRLYSFLSQIFDYGSTAVEARSIFYRRLIPLLEFGREREGVDLSKVVLTHHKLRAGGKIDLTLGTGAEKLRPLTETGSASVQDKEKALLAEIIARMNDLFAGVTDGDTLSYFTTVKTKLLENETLAQQADSNHEKQFENSPALSAALTDAVMEAFGAHSRMGQQTLESQEHQRQLLKILLGPGQLYEALRKRAA